MPAAAPPAIDEDTMRLPQKNLIEWLVFGLSLGLVLLVIAALVFEVLRSDTSPARFEVRLGTIEHAGAMLHVPVTVSNLGGRMAEDVLVEVRIERGGETETAELQFPRLARQETATGSVIFPQSPAPPDHIEGHVASYGEP